MTISFPVDWHFHFFLCRDQIESECASQRFRSSSRCKTKTKKKKKRTRNPPVGFVFLLVFSFCFFIHFFIVRSLIDVSSCRDNIDENSTFVFFISKESWSFKTRNFDRLRREFPFSTNKESFDKIRLKWKCKFSLSTKRDFSPHYSFSPSLSCLLLILLRPAVAVAAATTTNQTGTHTSWFGRKREKRERENE